MFDLYKEWMSENHPQSKPVEQNIYRSVFNKNFNLGFHKPKKDACSYCAKYKNANAIQKRSLENLQTFHIQQKNLSRAEKLRDKEICMTDPETKVFTMDLQSVLHSML